MNTSLMLLEIAVVLSGLLILLGDLWTHPGHKKALGYAAATLTGFIFLISFSTVFDASFREEAAFGLYVMDGMALFFKRLFLAGTTLVLILAAEYSDRIESGVAEYFALILFALSGMMFAASANSFAMLFVSLELVTITFYILTSYQRECQASLEGGVKYLIVGALSSGVMVFGIALVFGVTGSFDFQEVAYRVSQQSANPLLWAGLLMVLVGLGFKLSAAPFHFWAPDVYQGAPLPTTAFLATGSKAAGLVLLLRVFYDAVPSITPDWSRIFMVFAGLSILVGNLGALQQRDLKRLLGYSSIAHAGYLLLGVAAANESGQAGMMVYIAAYFFTVIAAFVVVHAVVASGGSEQVDSLKGLLRRSPWLGVSLVLSMVSLAGIPPLAGFFGKFMLFSAIMESAARDSAFYWAALVAILGVIISMYYYLNIVRLVVWSEAEEGAAPVILPRTLKIPLAACVAGMILIGLFPGDLADVAFEGVFALAR